MPAGPGRPLVGRRKDEHEDKDGDDQKQEISPAQPDEELWTVPAPETIQTPAEQARTEHRGQALGT
jgi:hypothetical protein